MKKKPLLVLFAAAGVAGALAFLVFDRAAERGANPPEAPQSSARDEPGKETAAEPAPSKLSAGDAQERHLVGVVLREDTAQSQAHIMRRGVTGVYRLKDEVPPDRAVLTSIQMTLATLQPPEGGEIILKLENLSDEERFLYSPNVNLDEVEDVVGNLYEAETPEGKALLEKYPDPHAPCGEFKDEAEQVKCEDRIDADMEAAAEKCDEIDDAEEYDQCLETAYRFTAEAAARAKAQQ